MIYVSRLTVVNCRDINPELCEMTVILVKLTVVGTMIYVLKVVFSYLKKNLIRYDRCSHQSESSFELNRQSQTNHRYENQFHLTMNYKCNINDIISSMIIHYNR